MFESFYQEYQEQAFEAIVLIHEIKGVIDMDDYAVIKANALILIAQDGYPQINEFSINWPVTYEQVNSHDGVGLFANLYFYRLMLSPHQGLEALGNQQVQAHLNQRFCLRQVLEGPIVRRDLENLRAQEIQINLEDPQVGKLLLCEPLNAFCTQIWWQGHLVNVYLEVDADNRSNCQHALIHARTILTYHDNFNDLWCKFITNNYQGEAQESYQVEIEERSGNAPLKITTETRYRTVSMRLEPYLHALAIKANGFYSANFHHNCLPQTRSITLEGSTTTPTITNSHWY